MGHKQDSSIRVPALPRVTLSVKVEARWILFGLFILSLSGLSEVEAVVTTCPPSGQSIPAALPPGNGEDLEITGPCTVGPGTYHYRDINIYNGGSLTFSDAKIDFWSRSILIENNSSLVAGTPQSPIGTAGGLVTFYLYGRDQGAHPFGASQGMGGQGIVCKTDVRCGVPAKIWDSNGTAKMPLPRGVMDYFYAYGPLPYDDGGSQKGFFGYKVLAVSYGGTLQLFGNKGATFGTLAPSESGTSWVRLAATLNAGENSLVLDRPMDWEAGDQIVVTTTDYLPGHSEQFTITAISPDGLTLSVDNKALYIHNGEKFDLSEVPARVGLDKTEAETRAAVALLSRSIRVVAKGDAFMQDFPSGPGHYFGGHTLVRQGVKTYQVQGVEFYQLGQGGRIGHYPVHFHMARQVPADTFVKDSSVHDSMTRWYTVHATHNVTLARNVGYQSIGHGFYIEDGTEINNRFYSNIGILARAAVDIVQNPRQVPGILASADQLGIEAVPYHSDFDHPAVFWVMNTYNDFEYNMAAGATACGACYWMLPASNSGPSFSRKWESYASIQRSPQNSNARAGTAPIKKFQGNYCSSAMNSFNVVGNTAQCLGIASGDVQLAPVKNPLVPGHITNPSIAKEYFPRVDPGGLRFPTWCDETDCSMVPKCSEGNLENCLITALDDYTTAFNWTETNFSAIWLRPQWYLVIDSVISDVQNAGLTFVTGGDYTRSSTIGGHWSLARQNAFIGNTQENNPFASNAGPFNPETGLECDNNNANYCLSQDEGISMPISNFAVNQRLFNIYDGPAYQDSNAFMNIKKTVLDDCKPGVGNCFNSKWMYGRALGVPIDHQVNECILPNAAIAWKQPNGFYYPPAFHSTNLFFEDVDIRHFVIEPLFKPGTFETDDAAVAINYCTHNISDTFTGFTDIDRQTVLNDDDGSLTGFEETTVVNQDVFFEAPVSADECRSEQTAKTSPYDYVTSVVYPGCAANGTNTCTDWSQSCANPNCYGVPMRRQYVTDASQGGEEIRMMQQAIWQRNNLTANNGLYYIDTTVSKDRQQRSGATDLNVFKAGGTYYFFLIYAKPSTMQRYQLYVGTGGNFSLTNDVELVRTGLESAHLNFLTQEWPASWSREYEPSTGILTVTMDFGGFEDLFDAAKEGNCQPSSFCEWNDGPGQCQCALQEGDYLFEQCSEKNLAGEDAICSWAVRDIDCPSGGCFGFSVTLPSTFETDPVSDPRPPAACFPTMNWDVSWMPATPDIAGACFNPEVPLVNFCDFAGPASFTANVIEGTDRRDRLFGTSGRDIILGHDGNDIIRGRGGHDWIAGGEGHDVIFGGRGSDTLFGDGGNDRIRGGAHDDNIDGGTGFDRIHGGRGDDACSNGESTARCEY